MHPGGDEHGAKNTHERNLFIKQQPTNDHRDKGSGVEVVVGNDHPQALEGNVPQSKANGIAEHTQKQPAQKNSRLSEQRGQVGHSVCYEHQRHGSEKCPQKYPAGDQKVIILFRIVFYEDGVYCPHQRCSQGQQVAHRAEVEGKRAVEHHHDNAGNGHHGANIHPFAQLFPSTGKHLGQNDSKDGGHRNQNAYIGGRGVGRSGVLQEKVKAAASNADKNEPQLVPQGKLQNFRPQSPQSQICKTHAQGNDLNRGEGPEHHLGQYKAAAPHQRGEQSKQMPGGFLAAGKGGLRHKKHLLQRIVSSFFER